MKSNAYLVGNENGQSCQWGVAAISTVGIFAIFIVWTTPADGGASLLKQNYWLSHLLFGGVGPFLLGLVGRPTATRCFTGWSLLPFRLVWKPGWSMGTGLFLTALVSIWNEIIWDPRTNHIPFADAWQDFAADMAGMAMFLSCFAVAAAWRRTSIPGMGDAAP